MECGVAMNQFHRNESMIQLHGAYDMACSKIKASVGAHS